MNKVENWKTIILYAHSVRYTIGSAVASLVVAWYTKEIAVIIPAVLSVAVIFARITPQPMLHAQDEMAQKAIREIK